MPLRPRHQNEERHGDRGRAGTAILPRHRHHDRQRTRPGDRQYSAQKGFTGGFAAFHIGLVAGVVTLLVGMTGFIVVPLRRMRVMTIPEFYEKRFGRGVRVLGGVILALAGILNMGLFLKAGTAYVTGLTGMTSDVELKIVMSVLLGLVLIYMILGGMISVVITDYIQFVALAFGLLAVYVLAVRELGWDSIITTVQSLKSLSQKVWYGFAIRVLHRLETGATGINGIGSKGAAMMFTPSPRRLRPGWYP